MANGGRVNEISFKCFRTEDVTESSERSKFKPKVLENEMKSIYERRIAPNSRIGPTKYAFLHIKAENTREIALVKSNENREMEAYL